MMIFMASRKDAPFPFSFLLPIPRDSLFSLLPPPALVTPTLFVLNTLFIITQGEQSLS